MNEIKRGDLVMVVGSKKCGCESPAQGMIFTVSGIGTTNHCNFCGVPHDITPSAFSDTHHYRIETHRLRRIDPPATGEYDGVPVRKNVPRKQPTKETA